MAAVEIFFHRVLTDDRWMNQAACKGLTHLFFPPPAERPQARDRREAAAKAVCASCIVHQHVPGVRQDEPRVRVLGWRERRRAPLRRLSTDRPDRRTSPQRRLTLRPFDRNRPRQRTTYDRRMSGAPTHRQAVDAAWAAYGDPRTITGSDEVSANVSTNRVYRLHLDDGSTVVSKVSSYGSYFLFVEDHEQLDRCARCLGSTRFAGMLADIWSRDGRIFTWYDQHMWAVFYDDVPRPRCVAADPFDPSRSPTSATRDRRVPPGLHRHRAAAAERFEDDQERRHPPARSAGEPVRATQLRRCRPSRSACCGSTPTAFSSGSSRLATTSGRRSRS